MAAGVIALGSPEVCVPTAPVSAVKSVPVSVSAIIADGTQFVTVVIWDLVVVGDAEGAAVLCDDKLCVIPAGEVTALVTPPLVEIMVFTGVLSEFDTGEGTIFVLNVSKECDSVTGAARLGLAEG